jgi:hypothetical protein
LRQYNDYKDAGNQVVGFYQVFVTFRSQYFLFCLVNYEDYEDSQMKIVSLSRWRIGSSSSPMP